MVNRVLPFLTVVDPEVSGEGALDPLGLGPLGERLAEQILPGLTNRMQRPRFLTAMAVSALVCQGLEDDFAADGVTPAHIVFEWLVAEAFARAADPERYRQTPGIEKARAAIRTNTQLAAKSYLKTPTVFGFHGIYKRLARNLRIAQEGIGIDEKGHELLRIWEREQELAGFVDGTDGPGAKMRATLRSAVESSIGKGYSDRSWGWGGWELLSEHLAPVDSGRQEAAFIYQLLLTAESAPRGEVFSRIAAVNPEMLTDVASEADLARDHLMAQCSTDLKLRLARVDAYEKVSRDIERAFDWARYASTRTMPRPLSPAEYAGAEMPQVIAGRIAGRIRAAADALDGSDPGLMEEFLRITRLFEGVTRAEDLLQTCLQRHAEVQKAKPPEGKREWFQATTDGRVIVRPAYKLTEGPEDDAGWGRPYRLWSVASFCGDLVKGASHAA